MNASESVTVIGESDGEKSVLKEYNPSPQAVAVGGNGDELLSVSETTEWNEGSFTQTNANSPLKLNTDTTFTPQYNFSVVEGNPGAFTYTNDEVFYDGQDGVHSRSQDNGTYNFGYEPSGQYRNYYNFFAVSPDGSTAYVNERYYDYPEGPHYYLTAVDTSNESVKWEKNLSADAGFQSYTQITADEDYIYGGYSYGSDQLLFAMNKSDKTIEWEKNLSYNVGQPYHYDGKLHVVTGNQELAQFNSTTGDHIKNDSNFPDVSLSETLFMEDKFVYVSESQEQIGVYNIDTETSVWTSNINIDTTNVDYFDTDDIAVDDGVLYMTALTEDEDATPEEAYHIHGIDIETGDLQFTKNTREDNASDILEIQSATQGLYGNPVNAHYSEPTKKFNATEEFVSSGEYNSKTYTYDSNVYWGHVTVETNMTSSSHNAELVVNGDRSFDLSNGMNKLNLNGMKSDEITFKLNLQSTDSTSTPQIKKVAFKGKKEQ